jgi:hypothetical protein
VKPAKRCREAGQRKKDGRGGQRGKGAEAGDLRWAAKSARVPPASVTDIERFERVLLRRSVGALTADRNRCADCGRTPLVGERVHLYERPHVVVCELCRSLRRDAPVASETVRYSEHGHNVRLAARAA